MRAGQQRDLGDAGEDCGERPVTELLRGVLCMGGRELSKEGTGDKPRGYKTGGEPREGKR